jgi:hypothetical protein
MVTLTCRLPWWLFASSSKSDWVQDELEFEDVIMHNQQSIADPLPITKRGPLVPEDVRWQNEDPMFEGSDK